MNEVADSSGGTVALCAGCQLGGPKAGHYYWGAESMAAGASRTGRVNLWVILLVVLCTVGLLCIIGLFSLATLFPMRATVLELQQRHACTANLQQISAALDAYKLKYGTFPPPYLTDDTGKPAHSWRVLLLPFYEIEEYEKLYEQYSFDEPWDGQNNSKLHHRMPDFYGCPSDPDAFDTDTSYLALTTSGATSVGAVPVGMRSPNLDPTAQLVVVEVRGSGIVWTQPRDIDVGGLTAGVNDASGQGINSFHLEGANVLEDDGEVTFLENGDTGPGVTVQSAPESDAVDESPDSTAADEKNTSEDPR